MVKQRDESGATGTATEKRREQQSASAPSKSGNGATETGSRKSLTRWPALLGGGGMPAGPWELMRRMSEEMGQLFESLGGTRAGLAPLPQAVRADLPGLTPEDINVTVDQGALTISGERRQENREEREGFIRSELSYGAFFRTIPLPESADEKRVNAVFRNGVLEITVPVSDQQQGRRVTVEQ